MRRDKVQVSAANPLDIRSKQTPILWYRSIRLSNRFIVALLA
jgi:hypothetical protein